MHLVITDSGLGGLSICAGIERALRESAAPVDARLTYVNAWPEQGRGYNDLPDMPARARVFDGALQRMAGMRPDLIVIGCNTLSIVYEHTAFHRNPAVAVQGIVDAGIDLFAEALAESPGSGIVLLGTRTTIESGVHRDRLLRRGIAAGRVAGVSCHGLAKAIEQGPRSAATRDLIQDCTMHAAERAPDGSPLLVGLCCTHYGFVATQIQHALSRRSSREVTPLDPNARLVRDVIARVAARSASSKKGGEPAVEVVSKVTLNERQRQDMAELIEPVSPATAAALQAYRHVPDLFQEIA